MENSIGLKRFNPFHSGYWLTGTLAKSEDPDETRNNAAFHQGLHCSLRQNRSSEKKINKLKPVTRPYLM